MKNYCYYYEASAKRNSFFISCFSSFFSSQFFILVSLLRISNCVDLSVASSHHLSLFIAGVPFVIIIINNKLRSCSVFHVVIYFVVRLCIVFVRYHESSLNTIHNSQFSNGISIHLLFRI